MTGVARHHRPPCIGFPRPWHVRLRSWVRWQWHRLKNHLAGSPPPGEIKADRVHVHAFELVSHPKVRWSEFRPGKYDIIRPGIFRMAMEILWSATAEAVELRSFGPAASTAMDIGGDPALPSMASIQARRRRAAATARQVVASFRASGDRIPSWKPPHQMGDLAYYRLLHIAKEIA